MRNSNNGKRRTGFLLLTLTLVLAATGIGTTYAYSSMSLSTGKQTVTVPECTPTPPATGSMTLSLNYAELSITDTATDTASFEIYVDGTYNSDTTKTAETTKVDLSKLSIGDGKHNIQCKAKDSGGTTGDLSSSVEFNNGYSVTLNIQKEYCNLDGSGSDDNVLNLTTSTGTTVIVTPCTMGMIEIGKSLEGREYPFTEKNIVSVSQPNSYFSYTDDSDSFTHESSNGTFLVTKAITIIGSGTSQCIDENSMITMWNGEQKAMKDIEVGDLVLSIDYENMCLVPRKVIYTSKDEDNYENWNVPSYYKHTFSDGTVIKRAMNHRFYCLEDESYEYMHTWENGEHTYKLDGTNPELVSTEIIQEPLHYARITLEGSNNFFANGLATGDRKCCPNKVILNTKLEKAKE